MKRSFLMAMIICLMVTGVAATTRVNATSNSYRSLSEVQIQIANCVKNKETCHTMAECARALGYSEDNLIIKTAQSRWWQEHNMEIELRDLEYQLQNDYRAQEHPYAYQVWNYLLYEMNIPEPVAAGILGNMMSECGGQTLDLQPTISSGRYYGICQWYLPYTDGRLNNSSSIEDQLSYLSSTISLNIEMFGGEYTYFLSIESPYDAAYYFNKYYERGAWAKVRGINAESAYKYFIEGE